MRAPTCVALLVALLLPAMAAAQESTDLTGTVVFTMKGSFAKDEAAANDVGWGGISIGFTGDNAGKVRWFGVVHASLFGGNTFQAKTAIFKAHEVPALTVAGPPELAKQLAALPDGTHVKVGGAVDRRTKVVLLDMVQQLP